MPLEHLLTALERDAAEHAERLLAEARAQAERTTAASVERVARRRRETLGDRERELRGQVEHALSAARRVARGRILTARERLLDRVFASARGLLPEALSSAAFRAALPALLAEALECIGGEPAVIRCSEALVADVRALVSGDRASVVTDPTAGSGFRVANTAGTVEVDETLESRLERLRPALARVALRRLEVTL